jgi:hypothetical protein
MSRPRAYAGIPELAGPGIETAAGGVQYGVPGPRVGRMPVPTAEERAAAAAELADVIDRCQCSVVPGDVISGVRDLARRASVWALDGSGCRGAGRYRCSWSACWPRRPAGRRPGGDVPIRRPVR